MAMTTLNQEVENVYALLKRCLEEEKITYLRDFDDSQSDSLPDDPFGMGFNTLPRDPFGMDLNKEGLVDVWVEDLGLKENGHEDNNTNTNTNDDNDNDNNSFVVLWSDCMEYEQEDSWCFGCEKYENEDVNNGAELNVVWTECQQEEDWETDSMIYTQNYSYIVEDSWCFGCEKYEIIEHVKDDDDGNGNDNDNGNADGAAAADIIMFVLGYLNFGVKDLLSVEMVCKSLRDAVRKDPYLWTQIHVDHPFSQKMCNHDLLRLTDRAQGKLCSLGLLNCLMITDDGLQQVLQRNLQLTKVSLIMMLRCNYTFVLSFCA